MRITLDENKPNNLEEPLIVPPSVPQPQSDYDKYLEAKKFAAQFEQNALAQAGASASDRMTIELHYLLKDLEAGGDIFTTRRNEYIPATGKCYIPSCEFNARSALGLRPYPFEVTQEQLIKIREAVVAHWNASVEREKDLEDLRKRLHANFKVVFGPPIPPPGNPNRIKAWLDGEQITEGEWEYRRKEAIEARKESPYAPRAGGY